ncbi:methyltransferase domain protein [Aeromicrobium marinum DSM 15272]|uniref:Methyltransferase domain protein n=1 Tax=Aeromicrobium marinum DSM 15272 TaxID=585531 RepID=E2S8L2_9ACTN|nr:class I SAM-dependent methyltransferase [Aeromicrobium marinum]EFQ84517.1 methyltransferase domain protein [Aeromicrobium marinum DSM 15272]
MSEISARLASVVDALPLVPGMRVVEFGCGPGAAAREVARRLGDGHVLGVDRLSRAIEWAVGGAGVDGATLEFRTGSVETFTLLEGEPPYDLAFAVRVGVLDGRHPDGFAAAVTSIIGALGPGGRLFVDGDEISLGRR